MLSAELCESTEDFNLCIFKLNQNGIPDNLLNLSNVLRNRHHRIVLDGLASPWADINAGVP